MFILWLFQLLSRLGGNLNMVNFVVRETITKTLNDKMKTLTTMASGSGNSIPHKVANWGYFKAVSIAPHDTGALKRALNLVFGKKSAKLRLNRPQQIRKDGKPRDYHLWMHNRNGKDISAHIKSGDPKFMFTTAKLMQKYAIKQAAKDLKKKK